MFQLDLCAKRFEFLEIFVNKPKFWNDRRVRSFGKKKNDACLSRAFQCVRDTLFSKPSNDKDASNQKNGCL
uniref:Uncharacterized protein n=1 Tax=Rhizophora mucronata TaxID=61149 RepID=A0A2P2N3I0_RHIMU